MHQNFQPKNEKMKLISSFSNTPKCFRPKCSDNRINQLLTELCPKTPFVLSETIQGGFVMVEKIRAREFQASFLRGGFVLGENIRGGCEKGECSLKGFGYKIGRNEFFAMFNFLISFLSTWNWNIPNLISNLNSTVSN